MYIAIQYFHENSGILTRGGKVKTLFLMRVYFLYHLRFGNKFPQTNVFLKNIHVDFSKAYMQSEQIKGPLLGNNLLISYIQIKAANG